MADDSNPMDRGERGCQPPQRAFCSLSQQLKHPIPLYTSTFLLLQRHRVPK